MRPYPSGNIWASGSSWSLQILDSVWISILIRRLLTFLNFRVRFCPPGNICAVGTSWKRQIHDSCEHVGKSIQGPYAAASGSSLDRSELQLAIGKRIRICNYRSHTNRKLNKLIRTGRGWQFDGSWEGRIHATRRIWNSEISLAVSEGPPTTTGRLPPFRPERYLDVVTHCDYVRCPSVG